MSETESLDGAVLEVLKRYWGYDTLRPLQAEAVRASLDGRDSLVVMPTGGGKSLCYQIPPMVRGGVDVVVSPLISLMKDQVDGLVSCGVPAVALHSGMGDAAQRKAERAIEAGEVRLLFAAPERLLTGRMREMVRRIGPSSIVIDEAHCISHWGHDFRPEYRRLTELKSIVPDASWHALTATATERVREDIVAQLGLREPVELVGSVDRPNLVYRVLPRVRGREQLLEAVKRHDGEGAIVYCLSRKETEQLAEWLSKKGVSASAYHAGLSPNVRQRVQDRFMQERVSVVCATVAFGMGVDRSNVRLVVHMGMPKSVEHYQQESGRAGRDGLEAECVLLYSSSDVMSWRRLMDRSAQEAGEEGAPAHQLEMLERIRRFCASMRCRHQQLSEYFGQSLETERCGACDVCLGESEVVPESDVVAQKVLSAVARLRGSWGAAHVVDVLRGSGKEKIRKFGHDELSVYGLMADVPGPVIQSFIDQLCDVGALRRSEGDRPVVQLGPESGRYLKGEPSAELRKPRVPERSARGSSGDGADWDGVDMALFERLRVLRREIAEEGGVPAYVVFGDAALREMARLRPTSASEMLEVKGVGRTKLERFGDAFLECIRAG